MMFSRVESKEGELGRDRIGSDVGGGEEEEWWSDDDG